MVSKVSKIEDLEFYINDKINNKSIDKKNINVKVENNLHIFDGSADITTSIELRTRNNNELILKEKLRMVFEGDFKDYKQYYKSQDENDRKKLIDLSVRLSIEINSTIRGILFVKTKDYPMLSQIYLPLMDEQYLRMQINEDIK